MLHHSRFPFSRREGRTRALFATVVACACFVVPACIRRPVSIEQPTTKISFNTVVPQPAVEKIDLLVMVDNSLSMADKQRILADAVPDLVKGLVLPKCVDKTTRAPTGTLSDPTKRDEAMCPSGSEPAFSPITDMHIGVISSSLGGMGSDQCLPKAKLHGDDQAHLLARGPSGDVAAAGDLHFLAWYPDVEKNKDKVRHPDPPVPKTGNVEQLGAAFRDLIVGVGQNGCGLEAQLESVYRFLVQPDPWTAIDVEKGVASYGPSSRIDVELLRQRAAFLRPDSLVAVIVLTDEDDSSVDPLSVGGQGWAYMANQFPNSDVPRSGGQGTTAPRGTSICQTDPTSEDCTSCGFQAKCSVSASFCGKLKEDPSCRMSGKPGAQGPGFDGFYPPAEDNVNVRFHHMKQRFGVDPQFPIARYVDALTKPRVPLRNNEHDPSGSYAPKAGCTNPLFAARLPSMADEELCKLPRGPRSESLVYFALIGGVPNTLLPDATKLDAKIDWTKLLGRDPAKWDETGIDPHMVQSSDPRPGLPPASGPDDADPVHGREWTTKAEDLQFACTFDLYERNGDAAPAPVRRVCDPSDESSCDCNGKSDAPLCDAADPKVQVKGKAYPTRRELMVAKELGTQGIVASLCPKQLERPDADDYGYRPAVSAITSRLERSLVGSCLPRALERQDDGGNVACLVLAMLPDAGPDTECERFGLKPPTKDILEQTRDTLRAEEGEESTRHPICQIPQITVPAGEICKDASEEIAFCYAEAPALTQCPHALAFTKASQKLTFARFTLQCIQQSSEP